MKSLIKQSSRMKTLSPSFEEEQHLWRNGYEYVVGIDEVGRGAFAGPVAAAAVVFPKSILQTSDGLLSEINDSKLLLPERRKILSVFIQRSALFHTIAVVPVSVINKYGIGKASYVAFRRVIAEACRAIDPVRIFVLSDGFAIPYVKSVGTTRQKAIIKGDRISKSIAAASILAKVHRDNLMEQLHGKFENYNFKQNKGYGTREHRMMIKKYGLCKLHRKSFDLDKFL